MTLSIVVSGLENSQERSVKVLKFNKNAHLFVNQAGLFHQSFVHQLDDKRPVRDLVINDQSVQVIQKSVGHSANDSANDDDDDDDDSGIVGVAVGQQISVSGKGQDLAQTNAGQPFGSLKEAPATAASVPSNHFEPAQASSEIINKIKAATKANNSEHNRRQLENLIRRRRHQQSPSTDNSTANTTADGNQQAHYANRTLKAASATVTGRDGHHHHHHHHQEEPDGQSYMKRLRMLRQKYMTNRAISDRAYYILLVIYALFIAFGTVSNFLICLTVGFTNDNNSIN